MEPTPQKPAYLSDAYWSQLDPLSRELYDRIAPLPAAAYTVDVGVDRIEAFLASTDSDARTMGGHLELEPDFQRGHVWSDEQRIRYVEAFVRRIADCKIIFNSPAWSSDKVRGDIAPHVVQCVDGLQRLTSIRKFMAGDLAVFGGLKAQDLLQTAFSPRRLGANIQVCVYEFHWRSELLSFYIQHNSGGSVHSTEEIERVQALRDSALRNQLAQQNCGNKT